MSAGRLAMQLLDAATAAAFRAGGRLRSAPAFHPVGVAYRASVEIATDRAAPAFTVGTHPGVVRFSRGVGWPGLPDIHGLGIRIPDAHGPGRHQDLLVSSVLSGGSGRYVLRFGRTVSEPMYSTIAPYQAPIGQVVLGARFAGAERFDLERLDEVVLAGGCRFELLIAAGSGGWERFGVVTVKAARLDEAAERELRFNPWNSADGFHPTGLVNRLRRPAYPASQRGRLSAPGGDPTKAS